jgi:5'-nucleotidase
MIDALTGEPLGDTLEKLTIERFGKKIGVIGVGEKEWLDTLTHFNPEEDVEYEDFTDCANKLNKKLREEDGCDFVIALTHMRTPNDKKITENADIDLVLGGHDHSYEYANVSNKLLLKSGTDFRDLSRVEVIFFSDMDANLAKSIQNSISDIKALNKLGIEFAVFNKDKKQLFLLEKIEINSKIEPDLEVAEIVESYNGDFEKSINKVCGYTQTALDCRFEKIRTCETNFSNFLADMVLVETHCDCVLINSGSLRADCIYDEGILKLVVECNILD